MRGGRRQALGRGRGLRQASRGELGVGPARVPTLDRHGRLPVPLSSLVVVEGSALEQMTGLVLAHA